MKQPVFTKLSLKIAFFMIILLLVTAFLFTSLAVQVLNKRIMAGIGFTMLLGIACIIGFSSLITRPIKELSKGIDELKAGRRPKLRIYSGDEFGKLTESFNQITELTTRQQVRLTAYAQELEDSYRSTVKVLTAAIDARDPYTLGHSTRVAKLSVKIGEAIGLSRQELEDLEIASLFHDVGKLKTPDHVLLKDGPLDPMEHRVIISHCEYGAAILGRASSLRRYIPAVKHHHEWFNGKGYPDGLRGNDIPLHAAIIAVADAFDAMTSARPYKYSLSHEDALLELTRFSGSQFNPWLVEVFQKTLDSRAMPANQLSGKN
jgi:putative nucleotidyltransferase with HDIG domain